MTMRTRYKVECSCGHAGLIKLSENDQPYSDSWESYSAENLDSNGGFYIDGHADWDEVFKNMEPSCPKCGRKLSPSDLK